MRLTFVAALLALFFRAVPALADCKWTWSCNPTSGQCRQVPVCDSTLDIPPPRPPQVAPVPAPSIPPIPMPTVPPVGTQSCSPQYLCNSLGQCEWRTVCR